MIALGVIYYQASPAGNGFDQERFLRISSRMSEAVSQGEMIGGAGLLARNGRVLYQENYGMADKKNAMPVTDDTLFRIYSMTKPITTVAVLMLYEQGRFLLQDPIAKYLPELKDLKVALSTSSVASSNSAVGDGTTIEGGQSSDSSLRGQFATPGRQPTIIDLLTHTAGFSYGIFGATEVDQLYQAAGLGAANLSLEEYTRRLGKIPLQYEPGDRWHYSIATDVLGRLVEVISGKTFGEFLQTEIFEPLGMNHTQFRVSEAEWHTLARLYSPSGTSGDLHSAFGSVHEAAMLEEAPPSFDRGFKEDAVFESGGGGLLSTIRDYYRFCQMLLNGGELEGKRILSPKTVQLMTMNHLDSNETVWDTAGRGFGLGVAVSLSPAELMRIGSAGEYNWGGAAGTSFWIDPVENMIGIFFTQSMPHTTTLRDEFKQLSYQSLIESYVGKNQQCR